MIIRVVASPLSSMISAARSSPMARPRSTPNTTLLSKIRMVLWPTMPEPVTLLNSTRLPLGATMTRLRRSGRLGTDAQQARQELRRSLGWRREPALHVDLHEIGTRFAHGDATHQQRPEIDARGAFFHADVAALVIDIGEIGAKTAGNRPVNVLDAQRDLAHALGQARDGEAQAGLGVEHPGEERQEYE